MTITMNYLQQRTPGSISVGDHVEYQDAEYPEANGIYAVLLLITNENNQDIEVTLSGVGLMEGTITSFTLAKV